MLVTSVEDVVWWVAATTKHPPLYTIAACDQPTVYAPLLEERTHIYKMLHPSGKGVWIHRGGLSRWDNGVYVSCT